MKNKQIHLVFLSLFLFTNLSAQFFQLDYDFGEEGKLYLHQNLHNCQANDLQLTSDGNILIANSRFDFGTNAQLYYFESDGTPVTSFGENGLLTINYNGIYNYTMKIRPDGNEDWLIGGYSNTNGSFFFPLTWKTDQQGQLIESYGDQGVAKWTGLQGANAVDMGMSKLEETYLTGYRWGGDSFETYVCKTTPSGQQDLSFGNQGIVFINDTLINNRVQFLRLDAEDKLWIASEKFRPNYSAFICSITKMDENGIRDQDFGNNGEISLFPEIDALYMTISDGKFDEQGRFVVCGHYFDDSFILQFYVMRFLSNGVPDPSFGVDGRVVITQLNLNSFDALTLEGGRINIFGTSLNSGKKDLAVLTLGESGNPLPQNGENGFLFFDSLRIQSIVDVEATADGFTYVLGMFENGNQDDNPMLVKLQPALFSSVGVVEENRKQLRIYPNPASEYLLIQSPTSEERDSYLIQLVDTNGRYFNLGQHLLTPGMEIELPLPEVPAGAYTILLSGAKEQYAQILLIGN